MTDNYNRTLSAEQKEKLRAVKHVALDMDGTIYLGSNIFPYTLDFLRRLSDAGIGYSFLTNNPTKSIADYLAKLAGMGIHAEEENMYTTSVAAAEYIHRTWPDVKRLFLLGTPSMTEQFRKAGFEACEDDPNDRPDALVVGFDPTLVYSRLCRAAWWASQGIRYVATNPDRVCPTDQPTVLVDCGSLQKCIEHATGRKPDIVLGKPDPTMLDGIRIGKGLKAEEIVMAGDRIYTDTAMAHNAGAVGCLVLSGETTLETALEVARKEKECESRGEKPEFYAPDFIVRDVAELADLLIAARK